MIAPAGLLYSFSCSGGTFTSARDGTYQLGGSVRGERAMAGDGGPNLEPVPPTAFDGQRFNDFFTPVGGVIFTAVALSIAISTIGHGSGNAPVIPLLLVGFGLFFLLRATYQAVLYPDGSLVFKSLLRTARTNIDNVNRVRYSRGPRGGASWEFYFDGTMRAMSTSAGRSLADLIAAKNPSVQHW